MDKLAFQTRMTELFPWLTSEQFAMIEKYKTFLQTANKTQNLTRIDGEEQIYQEYFLASVLLYNAVITPDETKTLLDIGSGSGIPGVLLKIIYPNLAVTLLDSNQKKTTFLTELVQFLGLDVTIWCGRAEELAFAHNEAFDYVTARAVAETRKLLEISARFCKISGLILLPKSQNWANELTDATGVMEKLFLVETNHFSTVDHDHSYHLLAFEKTKATPKDYPRAWGAILKKPL